MTGVIRLLVNTGIPYDSIPQEWAAVITAATIKYLTGHREGVEETFSRLHLDQYKGNSEKAYFVTNENETICHEVQAEDITFTRGVVVNGFPIPFKRLSISDKDKLQCDDCGILSHCQLDVRDPGTDKIKSLCNNCVTYHENPRVKDLGGRDLCVRCTLTTCVHHPHRGAATKR